MLDEVTVRLVCPTCSKVSHVKIPLEKFPEREDNGLVTVSFDQSCGHSCHVFIDKKFKQRGGSCADHALEAREENGIDVQLFDEESRVMSEIVIKLSTELILMGARDMEYIKSINANEKMGKIECALLNGDIKKAGEHLGELWEFAKEIGEIDFAERLQVKIKKINQFLIEKSGFSWEKIVLKDDPALPERVQEKIKALRKERIDKVISELKIEAKLENITTRDFEEKRAMLLRLQE